MVFSSHSCKPKMSTLLKNPFLSYFFCFFLTQLQTQNFNAAKEPLLLFHSNIQSWQMRSLPTLDPYVFLIIKAKMYQFVFRLEPNFPFVVDPFNIKRFWAWPFWIEPFWWSSKSLVVSSVSLRLPLEADLCCISNISSPWTGGLDFSFLLPTIVLIFKQTSPCYRNLLHHLHNNNS